MHSFRTLLTTIAILGLYRIGGCVNITVIDGLLEGDIFECNNPVTFRCSVNPNSFTVRWSVGNPIGKFPDSDCFGSGCGNSAMFPGRYSYTYDKSAGISYLKIANASFDDDQMIYQCSNGSIQNSYNTTTIKALPKFNSTIVTVNYSRNNAHATLTTGCIYPAEDLSLLWYSTLVNGSDLISYPASHKQVPCLPVSNCMHANTSIESVLVVQTSTTGQERLFYVNISFGSVHFSKDVGKYNVTLDKTETTTYSTVKLTPTPTIVITSTPTPVITPTQTIVISPTPTTVVSPTSTIVVASSSTDKPSSSTKQNFSSTTESNKSVIIASSIGGVVILIIIISACVCYKKRKIRTKRKARKLTFSKEDTNIQEIKL